MDTNYLDSVISSSSFSGIGKSKLTIKKFTDYVYGSFLKPYLSKQEKGAKSFFVYLSNPIG